MAEEFEGDLTEAVFWGADLARSHFRDVNLAGATITHSWLVDVEIDAFVDRMVVNGVDVTAYVNEHDPWYPLRAMLRPTTVEEARATWSALEGEWATTTEQALALPEDRLHESVDGEWSFLQTVRHLVFAIDKWFTAPVLEEPFDPIGLPNRGSVDFPWPGLEYDRSPSASDALGVLADRATRVRRYLEEATAAELDRSVDVLENGPHRIQDCLFTVFEEEFWHIRYARRDLAQLAAGA
jgi:hypothetical protein